MTVSQFLMRVRRVLQDAITGKYSLAELLGSDEPNGLRTLGLDAKTQASGFTFDGSRYIRQGSRNETAVASQVATARERFATRDLALRASLRVQPESVAALRDIVTHLQALDVEVIGLIMPYTLPSLTDQMRAAPDYAPVFAAQQDIHGVFESLDAELFDFFDSGAFGLEDTDIADGTHTTAPVTGQILAEMIRQSPSLRTLADAACAADASCTRAVQ
jgi:hypothetical protein